MLPPSRVVRASEAEAGAVPIIRLNQICFSVGRWGTPADLGGTAVFLASRASDYVNGAIIPVDGGWLAR